MSAVFDEQDEYLKSPYFKKHIYSDFSPFYVAITICSIIALCIIILNFVLACCSKHSHYWNDRHTGNRWITTLWTATPHNQPSLDYTELQDIVIPQQTQTQQQNIQPSAPSQKIEYSELQKRESDI